MKTILIATTNQGKFEELSESLKNLPIKWISLASLEKKIAEPEETENSVEGNAILKAKYYGKETGCITLADDAGILIDVLGGWPGVKSARIGEDTEERKSEVLSRLKDTSNRGASFIGALALYDPKTDDLFVSTGTTRGSITTEGKGKGGFGYDPIFYADEIHKTYAEMRIEEKNKISHRAKALVGIKRYLINIYGGKHVMVPIGIVVKDGKILLNKRNDIEKPELHGLWEFPGGGMEVGETIEENLVREVREECGYTTEIISQLRCVWTVQIKNPRSSHYGVQIYLVPFVCRIISGDGTVNDEEVLETAWSPPDEVEKYNLIGENKKMYKKIYHELVDVITHNNL